MTYGIEKVVCECTIFDIIKYKSIIALLLFLIIIAFIIALINWNKLNKWKKGLA